MNSLIANLLKKPAFLLAAFLFVAAGIIITVLVSNGKIDLNFSSASMTIRVCEDLTTDPANCTHTTIQSAVNDIGAGVNAFGSGGVITIAPGDYNQCASIPDGHKLVKPGITIRGELGVRVFGKACGDKGAFVVRKGSENVTIEGIECFGINSSSGNGACV